MQILWSERAYTRRQAIEDYVLYAFGFVAYQDYIDAKKKAFICYGINFVNYRQTQRRYEHPF